MAQCLLIVVSLLILVDATFCLRMVMLDVPSVVIHGASVELSCIYELENDRLYSIKWYRNDVEFYRYVPNDRPPGQFQPLPGVKVDLSKSGQRSVYLRHVDLNSTGTYRCQVSAESLAFQSVEAERDMKVFVLPTEGPKITGEQVRYSAGDTVNVNCTSAKSKPATTLRWFINDNPVGPEYETEYSTILREDRLESSTLNLRFVAKDRHFVNQTMRLKCTASISRIYTTSNEIFVRGRQPLQTTENGSKGEVLPKAMDTQEKPLKSLPNPKRNQPKRLQCSCDGSVFSFCHWLLELSVLMLHLRTT